MQATYMCELYNHMLLPVIGLGKCDRKDVYILMDVAATLWLSDHFDPSLSVIDCLQQLFEKNLPL